MKSENLDKDWMSRSCPQSCHSLTGSANLTTPNQALLLGVLTISPLLVLFCFGPIGLDGLA